MELVRYVRKLLGVARPVHEELSVAMLVRNHQYKQQYRRWMTKNHQQELLKNLYTSFTLSKLGVTGDVPLHYFSDGRAHHILIHYIDPMDKVVLSFIQDYFRDKIMRLGFNLYHSERRVMDRVGYTDTIERHVLKPYIPSFAIDDVHERFYGNIQVSVHFVNDRPLFLQLTAEPLTEQDYQGQFSFDDLVEVLFM